MRLAPESSMKRICKTTNFVNKWNVNASTRIYDRRAKKKSFEKYVWSESLSSSPYCRKEDSIVLLANIRLTVANGRHQCFVWVRACVWVCYLSYYYLPIVLAHMVRNKRNFFSKNTSGSFIFCLFRSQYY